MQSTSGSLNNHSIFAVRIFEFGWAPPWWPPNDHSTQEIMVDVDWMIEEQLSLASMDLALTFGYHMASFVIFALFDHPGRAWCKDLSCNWLSSCLSTIIRTSKCHQNENYCQSDARKMDVSTNVTNVAQQKSAFKIAFHKVAYLPCDISPYYEVELKQLAKLAVCVYHTTKLDHQMTWSRTQRQDFISKYLALELLAIVLRKKDNYSQSCDEEGADKFQIS